MPLTHHRLLIRQLLPGVALPGLIYLVVSRAAPLLVALAAASSVPLLDLVYRLARRRAPSPAGLAFLGVTGVSVGLALWLRSPLFILAKGAIVSAVVGTVFAVSALVGRPLTRTMAVALSAETRELRLRLSARWSHPGAERVFRTLSLGWAALLLVSAAQQAVLVLTVSPGAVMAVEPPLQLAATAIGIAASVAYVRRRERAHPNLGLLTVRAAA